MTVSVEASVMKFVCVSCRIDGNYFTIDLFLNTIQESKKFNDISVYLFLLNACPLYYK